MMIPRCDYVVVTKSDLKTLDNTLYSIRKQGNVNRIILVQSVSGPTEQFEYILAATSIGLIDRVIMEDVGLAYARMKGIEEVQTKYFVFVDADVELTDTWIQEMWPYMRNNAAIHGRLYRNRVHAEYLAKCELLSMPVTVRMFTHNTIIQKYFVRDWKPPEEMNAYEDYHLTQYIIEGGGDIRVVPVFAFHDHQGSDFRAAVWGGAGAKFSGRFTRKRDIFKTAIRIILGGFKRSFKMRARWFAINGLRGGIGLVWGYLRWRKYLKKDV